VKTERFLVTLLKESYPKGLRAVLRRRSQRRLSGGAFYAICETLDVIGTKDSIEVLKDLSKRASEPARQKLQRTIVHIASRAELDDPRDRKESADTSAR